MSLQLLIILVPVIFGLMGFAIDLGRLWLIRGEVNQAASAMALAAASQMTGAAATENMYMAATAALSGVGNRYNFGGTEIAFDPSMIACYTSVAGAASNDPNSAADCASPGVAVQASITVDAPLIFWSLLPGGETRLTKVASYAVAGMSAPLCTACGIEPFAVAALDEADTVNFGFGDPAAAGIYTLAFSCTGNQTPTPLAGANTRPVLPYLIVNRYDSGGALDEGHQAFRAGAAGLFTPADPATPNPTGSPVPMACMAVNDPAESIWPSAIPPACTGALPATVTSALCGLDSRFEDTSTVSGCSAYADIAPLYLPDRDTATGVDAYASYTGNGRRVITVAVVRGPLPTAPTGTMTVLGFRQFLLQPNPDATTFINPTDVNGRFNAMYIGNPKAVPQGWFDDRFGLACTQGSFSGPGKVVLHQ